MNRKPLQGRHRLANGQVDRPNRYRPVRPNRRQPVRLPKRVPRVQRRRCEPSPAAERLAPTVRLANRRAAASRPCPPTLRPPNSRSCRTCIASYSITGALICMCPRATESTSPKLTGSQSFACRRTRSPRTVHSVFQIPRRGSDFPRGSHAMVWRSLHLASAVCRLWKAPHVWRRIRARRPAR